jgi:glucose/arabinose dehydrogenase
MLDDPFEETLRWANIVDYNHIDPNVMLLGRQTGQIHAFRAQANGQLIDQGMFLDLSSVVFALGERGLIGIALHKNYAQNGRMFVTVSCRFGVPPYGDHCERDGGTIIMEYSVPMRTISSIISGGSRPVFQKVILSVPKPYGNHNGGQLLFSPAPQENNLFIFLGDGGGQGDPEGFSQNMNVLHGKVLRIDVDNANPYGIPADNPFANMTNGIRREIFAYGLRNPWRNSIDFHRPSRIFTGDVARIFTKKSM